MKKWSMDQGECKAIPLEEISKDADKYNQQDIWLAFVNNCRSTASDGILPYVFSAPSVIRGTPFDDNAMFAYIALGASAEDPKITLTYIREHYPNFRDSNFTTRIEADERQTNQINQVVERLKAYKIIAHRIERSRWGKAQLFEGSDQKLNHALNGIYNSLPQQKVEFSAQSSYLKQGGK